MKILVIDNYDSFTYNLVQYFGELGAEIVVKRNDEVSIAQIRNLRPDRICISPGPGRPEQTGICPEVIRELGRDTPILAEKLMHGKTSAIKHSNRGIFAGAAQPLEATRYHSLVVRRDSVPDSLEITADSDDGEIMGLQHREFPLHGVQFHPESILTGEGKKLLANFLKI